MKATMNNNIVWIDLDNTPHVPFFKPIIEELEKRGHEVFFPVETLLPRDRPALVLVWAPELRYQLLREESPDPFSGSANRTQRPA